MIEDLVLHIGDVGAGSSEITSVLEAKGFGRSGMEYFVPTGLPRHALARSLQSPKRKLQKSKRFTKVKNQIIASDLAHGIISSDQLSKIEPSLLAEAINSHFSEFKGRIRIIAYARPHIDAIISNYLRDDEFMSEGTRDSSEFEKYAYKSELYYTDRFTSWRDCFQEKFELRPLIPPLLNGGNVVSDFFSFVFSGENFETNIELDSFDSLDIQTISLMRVIGRRLSEKSVSSKENQKKIARAAAISIQHRSQQGVRKAAIHHELATIVAERFRDDAMRLDREFFDGSPFSQALEEGVQDSVREVQSYNARDYFDNDTLRYVATFGDALASMLDEDEKWIVNASNPIRSQLMKGLLADSPRRESKKVGKGMWRKLLSRKGILPQ